MTPDKDVWIPHNGDDKCPVDQDTWVCVNGNTYASAARDYDWARLVRLYRVFAPVAPKLDTPSPSPFVSETAARIMAAMIVAQGASWSHEDVSTAVAAALALEAALNAAGK